MKNKLSFLLLIAGGVLAALRLSAFAALPAPAVAVAGGFLLGFSYLLFNSVYAGTVWGVRIKSSGAGSFKQIFGAVGLVIGGFSLVHTGRKRCGCSSARCLCRCLRGRLYTVSCFCSALPYRWPSVLCSGRSFRKGRLRATATRWFWGIIRFFRSWMPSSGGRRILSSALRAWRCSRRPTTAMPFIRMRTINSAR